MSDRPLRPDQAVMLEKIRESLRAGNRRPCIMYPTGGGKTRMMTEITKLSLTKQKKSIFLAPRRELIKQASKDLTSEGLTPSVLMAGYSQTKNANTYVASFGTLESRVLRLGTMELPDVGITHVDEAHLSIARQKMEIINRLAENSIVLGWTATPARGDGCGLGLLYDDLVLGPSPQELIDIGVLVPPKYYGCTADIDFDGLEYNSKAGDYTNEALASIEDKATLIGDVVTNWERLARDRHTVVFATTTKHARNLAMEFQRKGYKAASLDYTTPEPERASILERVADRRIQVLVNVFIASYGLDIPSLDCAVIARPTRNISLYLQTIGRVLRRFLGKKDALVIDHVRAIQENGFAEDAQPWCLDSDTNVKETKEKEKMEKKEPKDITCDSCSGVFRNSRQCPHCGHQMVRPDEQIPAWEYTLEEIKMDEDAAKRRLNKQASIDEKESFWRQLNYIARSNNYKQGWVSHKYRQMFGVWPNKINREGREKPTTATYAWLQTERDKNIPRNAESFSKWRGNTNEMRI